ncbi:MAG TPA: hypothetical protein VF961_03860, partial [Pyrinomonadaceae bacterium]
MKTNSHRSKAKFFLAVFGLLPLLFAACPPSAEAQTNTFPASGNVGIGTTTPASPLDISLPDANFVIFRNQGTATGTGLLIYARPASGTPAGQPLFWHFGARLDGGGGGWPTGALGIYHIISNGAGGSSGVRNFMFFDPNGNTVLNNTGGNVGIGTASPELRLDARV